MTLVPFFYVDVFAERPLTGNPLTLVPDADELTDDRMRAIAREFNQSETTFLLAPTRSGADHRLRSFTPIGAEVGGAGHNALGAWIWLAASGRLDVPGGTDGRRYVQEIGGDLLDVTVVRPDGARARIVMEQSAPVFGRTAGDPGALAGALALPVDALDTERGAQVVSTGAGHLLVPVRDRAVVDRAVPEPVALAAVLRAAGGEGCYVYAVEPGGAYARFFNPTMGIAEDPATGTAAGPLAARLVRDGSVPDGASVVVHQGHAVGRPSRIEVTVTGARVRLAGSGLVVARGELDL